MASDASDDGLSGLDLEVPDETVAPLVLACGVAQTESQYQCPPSGLCGWEAINMTHQSSTAIESQGQMLGDLPG